ncbi:cation:proton antiporter [Streptomyces lasalocidi]
MPWPNPRCFSQGWGSSASRSQASSLGAYAGARLGHLGHWEGLALGAGMNSRGVIEIIIAMVGLRLGVLSSAVYTIVVLVAIVTSLMAPPLLRLTMRRVEPDDGSPALHPPGELVAPGH